MTVLQAAHIITPGATLSPGWVRVEKDAIVDVGAGRAQRAADVIDLGATSLVPGFVDQHCHGGGTGSFTDGVGGARAAIATHRAHGTTSMVASLVTDTLDALVTQTNALAPLIETDELLGVHLEGPWLSEHHCGAHDPQLLRDPDPADVVTVLERTQGRVIMVTLAVERPGGRAAVSALASRGVHAALGHSHATFDQAQEGIAAGATVATHLYNAERPFHHREPGLIAALVADERVTVELIADGVHVHPEALKLAMKAAPDRFVLITDAMAATGAADGQYRLGPLDVFVTDGVARLASGTIAGSTLTMDAAVRFVVRCCGLSLDEAISAASTRPADLLGRADLGRIAPGAKADLVVLDDELTVRRVMRRGVWLSEEH